MHLHFTTITQQPSHSAIHKFRRKPSYGTQSPRPRKSEQPRALGVKMVRSSAWLTATLLACFVAQICAETGKKSGKEIMRSTFRPLHTDPIFPLLPNAQNGTDPQPIIPNGFHNPGEGSTEAVTGRIVSNQRYYYRVETYDDIEVSSISLFS